MLHKNKYQNVGNDGFVFDVGTYEMKQPYLKNRDYKFITDLTDMYNGKLSNGVMFYEILRMFDVGIEYDELDSYENVIDEQLQNHISESQVRDINDYTIMNRNQAKSNLVSYYQNQYRHTEKDAYDGYQREIRLPTEYVNESEELQGRFTSVMIECLHNYVQSPFRSRSHRIKVKKDLIEYIESKPAEEEENYAFEFDITASLVSDIIGDDVDSKTVETENVETEEDSEEPVEQDSSDKDDVDLEEFEYLGDYVADGSEIDKWKNRFTAIDNVLQNQFVSKEKFANVLAKAHDIDKRYAKNRLSDFEKEYKKFEKYEETTDITDEDVDKFTIYTNKIVNNRNKEFDVAKSLERQFDKIDRDNVSDVLNRVVANSTQVQYEFDDELGVNFIAEY